jgi:ribosome-binding protein aMBF1 (putative translation factor)
VLNYIKEKMEVSNLRSYLAETGMSIKQLSEKICYNTEYLRQVARGNAIPSHRLARDIFNITGGVVKLKTKSDQANDSKTSNNDCNHDA